MDTAPCTWPVSYVGCESPCESLASLPASGVAAIEEMATAYLWNWTGQKFGECELVVRPCRSDCGQAPTPTYWGGGPYPGPFGSGGALNGFRPALIDGLWWNIGCGSCGRGECGCGHTPTLELPGPVSSVTEILIDGAVLPSTAYRVDSGNLLIRLDGESWPRCQDLTEPASAADTWQVTYTQGVPVPVGGQVAAGVLACALAKAACKQDCGLPERLIQSVSRQGVTVQAIDMMEDIDVGHTGIWIIDSWVASVTKAQAVWSVRSPDLVTQKVRRTTWQAP